MQESLSDNRRKEERVNVAANVYVVVNTQPQMMGKMVEISSKGLAFTFVDLEHASQRLTGRSELNLDLFAGGKGYFIRDLNCRLVSQVDDYAPNAFSSMPVKRVGIEFEELTLPQQVMINSLVKQQVRYTHQSDHSQCV